MDSVGIDCIHDTPVGPVWLAVSERGLAAVEIGGSLNEFVQGLARRGFQLAAEGRPAPPLLREAAGQLGEYLAGGRRAFDLPIDWSGMGDFQQRALRLVAAVPYGQVTTYSEIARRVGRPHAARAVGRANATNPLPLVIPCHRVVGSDGKLHGYGAPWGIRTKQWLLELEGALERTPP